MKGKRDSKKVVASAIKLSDAYVKCRILFVIWWALNWSVSKVTVRMVSHYDLSNDNEENYSQKLREKSKNDTSIFQSQLSLLTISKFQNKQATPTSISWKLIFGHEFYSAYSNVIIGWNEQICQDWKLIFTELHFVFMPTILMSTFEFTQCLFHRTLKIIFLVNRRWTPVFENNSFSFY